MPLAGDRSYGLAETVCALKSTNVLHWKLGIDGEMKRLGAPDKARHGTVRRLERVHPSDEAAFKFVEIFDAIDGYVVDR